MSPKITVFVVALALIFQCQAREDETQQGFQVLQSFIELSGKIEQIRHPLATEEEVISRLALNHDHCLPKVDAVKNELEAKIESLNASLNTDIESRHDELESAINKTANSMDITKRDLVAKIETANEGTESRLERFESFLNSISRRMDEIENEMEPKIKSAVEVLIMGLDSRISQSESSLMKIANFIDSLSVMPACKDGWHLFEDSCYFFSTENRNWSGGRTDCIAMNADYVKVTTDEEREFITSNVKINTWVGLTDLEEEGTFRWISDKSLETNRNESWWHSGEPNDGGGKEDCIHFWLHEGKNMWNDAPCSGEMGFICEMSPTYILG